MEKVCIFGANGQTGIEILKKALDKDLEVRGCVRRKESLQEYSDRVEIFEYSFKDQASVNEALDGCKYIISAIGSGSYKEASQETSLYSDSVRTIVQGMKEKDLSRLLVISSGGAEPNEEAPWYYSYLLRRYFMNSYMDMVKMETVLEEATDEIDWTIVRPTYLQDGESKPYLAENRKLKKGEFKINRIDVADFMVNELLENEWIHKYPVLGYKK